MWGEGVFDSGHDLSFLKEYILSEMVGLKVEGNRCCRNEVGINACVNFIGVFGKSYIGWERVNVNVGNVKLELESLLNVLVFSQIEPSLV